MRIGLGIVSLLFWCSAFAHSLPKAKGAPTTPKATDVVAASNNVELACSPGAARGRIAKMLTKTVEGTNEFEIKRNQGKALRDYEKIIGQVFYINVEWSFGEYNEQLKSFPITPRVWETFQLSETHDGNRGYEKLILDKKIEYPSETINLSPTKADKYLSQNTERTIKGRAYFNILSLQNNVKSVQELGRAGPWVIVGDCEYKAKLLKVIFYTPDKGKVEKRY